MKWCGLIGYGETEETKPGVWTEQIVERRYFGDLIRNARSLQTSDKVNDNINISNTISIVADPYANKHFFNIRYITFQGAKWKVTNAEVQPPRIVLTIGGLYNG